MLLQQDVLEGPPPSFVVVFKVSYSPERAQADRRYNANNSTNIAAFTLEIGRYAVGAPIRLDTATYILSPNGDGGVYLEDPGVEFYLEVQEA